MMQQTISNAFKNAQSLTINQHSKLILFSDCHRGNHSYADDFSHNSEIYEHALTHYFENNFTYIELGDGIELWENRHFSEILESYSEVFEILLKFHKQGRLHLIWGNHDMIFKKQHHVNRILGSFFDKDRNEKKALFEHLTFHEAILLNIEEFNKSILLMHGHQADFFNYYCWKLSRFLVRHLWKPLQLLGYNDPTSPAKNHKELIRVEKRFKKWIQNNEHQMVITGHTHRPRFPKPDEIPYFNDGSCVHPKSITGLEIADLKISLIKWETTTTKDGSVKIEKTIIEGPSELSLYLS